MVLKECICLLLLGTSASAEQLSEEPFLTHIEQLTFPSMGFEKAGEAYFSPDGQTIIFQAVPFGERHYQIYCLNLTERIPYRVSTGKGACTCGYFRPDGKKIIFASSHESPEVEEEDPLENTGKYKWDFTRYMNIYEADLDGSSLRPLTSGPAYHAECGYSPDSSLIVYASNEDGSMNLYLIDAQGNFVTQLTHTTHCYNGGPFISPRGDEVLFRADRETPDCLQLFVIGIDGQNERQLTANGAVNWAPFWHPSGDVIAYTTSIHGHHAYEIYLLNIRTGIEHRLTHTPTFDGLPSFSYNGTKMVWTSKRGGGNCQIFMADFQMPLELQ